MSVELRGDKLIFLIGASNHQINGAKLPSNRQVLSVLFYNIREVKLTVRKSANLAIRECIIFWEKARIPTKALPNCVKKLVDLYLIWRELQKNCKKAKETYKSREKCFENALDNLFDIAHADALGKMRIEEDKTFLIKQRQPGRPGCLAGVDKKLADKEERSRQRRFEEDQRKFRQNDSLEVAPTSSQSFLVFQDSEEETVISEDDLQMVCVTTPQPGTSTKRGRKDLITPKLVAALDRCQLSIRDTVYVLQAVIEALDLNSDEFPINKSSIQRIRTQSRKIRAGTIKTDFQNNVPDVVTVHWDGKLLPGLDIRSLKEERLPILVSFDDREQLLAVPKIESSSGKDQAKAISNALFDWNLNDKVQIMCCDTTASNTGRFNGACALLEQNLERELLFFACRHHVYELVLKNVFETKVKQVSISPDIPLFKKFKDSWKDINSTMIELQLDFITQNFCETKITTLIKFYKGKLHQALIRDDYRELIELCIVFLGGDSEKTIKIRPPGAMHHARWMAKAIYSLKICLLQSQLKMTIKDKQAIQEVCLFVATSYVKPWLECNIAVKAPNQDLCYLKILKDYEKVDTTISKAAISKFIHHLWYLNEETVILSLFDNEVSIHTKTKMIANLNRDQITDFRKRYIPTKEEISNTLYGKFQYLSIIYFLL